MTISGQRFLKNQAQKPIQELVSGTKQDPKPIQITSSEAQTVSEATNPTLKQSSVRPQATMTPATAEQAEIVDRDYDRMVTEAEEYNLESGMGKHETPLLGKAVNIPREIEARYVTAGTQGRKESREKAESELKATSKAYESALGNQDTTQNLRKDAITVTDPYKMNSTIDFSNIDFKSLRTGAGSIGDVLPNVEVNADGTTAFLTNGTTTVAKPVIKPNNYIGTLNKAYNAVTYEYYTNGNLVNAQQFKEAFPEYKDVSDEEISRFINECAYDVENGNRRDISMYAENFMDMSMPDGYTSKHDSILSLYSDDNYITYGLSPFLGGSKTLDGRSSEDMLQFTQAVNTIKAYVDYIKEVGANIEGASDYVIAKQFADEIPELKQALDIYKKFDLKTSEFIQIDGSYNATLQDMRSFVENVEGLKGIEYDKFMTEYTHQYLTQFNEEFMNSWNKERLEGKLRTAGEGRFDNFIYGNTYQADGKFYDKKGNEIPQDDVHKGVVNRYLESLAGVAYQIDELNFDSRIAAMKPIGTDEWIERNADVIFDSVNLAFASMMSFTQGGIMFQGAMELPRAGAFIESLFDSTMEFLSGEAEVIGDMIGFTDGWSEESKQKYEEAMSGLGIMVLGHVKERLKGPLKEKLNNTAIIKAVKARSRSLTEGIKLVDEEGIKETIRRNSNPELTEEQRRNNRKEVKEETKKNRAIYTREWFKNSLKIFNQAFEEEYKKASETEGGNTIMDNLFQGARTLFQELTKQRGEEIKEGIKSAEKTQVRSEEKAPEITTETISEQPAQIEQTTTVSETQPTAQPAETTTVQAEGISTPEVRVEETTIGAPVEAEGTAKIRETDSRAEETKTTINKILDVMQKIQDNANEMAYNLGVMAGDIYERFGRPKTENIEKDTKKREQERAERDELFKREGLTKKQIEVVESNPFTDAIMRIVDRLVGETTDKKGRTVDVEIEDKMTSDEIQREVLSDGLTRVQKYVDRIQQMKKAIGQLYDTLSTRKTMRSRDFLNSEPFQRLLQENGLEYVEWIDEKKGPQRAIVADDGRVLNANERAVVKYLESMVDIITEKSWISERDAQSIRTNFTSKGDRDVSGDFPKAIKKTLYERWNEFLEQQGTSEVLRKIDQGYAELSENLDILSDLLGKDATLKDNAKNQILKWDEETLNQMDSILPGFKKLVELTKEAPDIVNKTIKAKTQYKQTRTWLGNWIRYGAVMLASQVGGRGGFILGSLGFTTLERRGNALKKKAVKTKLDRELYDQYVDALKVSGNEKAKYKQGELKRIEELNKIAEGKTQAEINKIMDEATQILIDRQAQEIRAKKQAEREIEQRRIEAENRQRQADREKAQQPIENALPGVAPDIVSPEGNITLGRGNPISPDKGPGRPKPLKESKKLTKVEEINKYNEAEQQIIDASLGKTEEKTYSPEAEKVADILDEQLKATADIIEQDATNKVIEKGEELTDENIQKEMQKEPSAMDDFIREMNETTPETETFNYDGADIKVLEDAVAHPEKYPNVDQAKAKSALEKAYRQNMQAEIMQSPDQQQAQKEIAGIYKGNQMELEHNKGWEKQREDMTRATNRDFDTLETTEEYDRIEKNISPEEGEMAQKYAKGYKGFYRADSAKTDLLLEHMGKGPSQNITYTSSSDKIATLKNPASRKRVAQQRINQTVDPKIADAKTEKTRQKWEDEKTALNQIIEQANTEIEAKKELDTQKRDLVRQRKALEKRREETPFRETKKELTKEIEKIEKQFDELTYENPEDVIMSEEAEIAGQEMMVEEDIINAKNEKNLNQNETPQKAEEKFDQDLYEEGQKLLEENETPQDSVDEVINQEQYLIDTKKYNPWKSNVAEREIKHENPKEKDIWTDSNGEELIFYHGTPQGGFEEFSMDFRGKSNDRFGNGDYGRGLYFTPYKKTAEGYTKHSKAKSTNPEIYEVKLKMENPLRLDLYREFQKAMMKLASADTKRGYSLLSKEHAQNIDRLMEEFGLTEEMYDKYEDVISDLGDNRWDMDIRNRGYDGIISEDGKEVIVPDTDQIIIQKHYSVKDSVNEDFKKTLEPTHKEFYHASDTDIKGGTFDLSKTKDDPNGIGLAVSLEKVNPYGNKANQYTIAGEDMKIAKSDTTLNESDVWDIAEILQIEPNANRQIVPIPELTSIIRGEVEAKYGKANNADILKAFNQVTGYDGVMTSHGYALLRNEGKINKGAKKSGGEKPAEPTTPKAPEPEPTSTPGGAPLVDVAKDGTVNKEPNVTDYTSKEIQDRIDYIKKKREDNGKKLFAQDLAELKTLQDLLKRRIERENREEGGTELSERQREIMNGQGNTDLSSGRGTGGSDSD